MAKNDKLGKLLLGSALAGAAIGTLTYFLKKKGQDSSWDDEDLEDFDDNLTDHKTEDDEDDDDTPVPREYVTIHTDHSHAEEAGEGSEAFEDETEEAPETEEKAEAPAEKTEEAAPAEEEAETPEEAVRTEEAPEAPAEETTAPASDETDAPEAE